MASDHLPHLVPVYPLVFLCVCVCVCVCVGMCSHILCLRYHDSARQVGVACKPHSLQKKNERVNSHTATIGFVMRLRFNGEGNCKSITIQLEHKCHYKVTST